MTGTRVLSVAAGGRRQPGLRAAARKGLQASRLRKSSCQTTSEDLGPAYCLYCQFLECLPGTEAETKRWQLTAYVRPGHRNFEIGVP